MNLIINNEEFNITASLSLIDKTANKKVLQNISKNNNITILSNPYDVKLLNDYNELQLSLISKYNLDNQHLSLEQKTILLIVNNINNDILLIDDLLIYLSFKIKTTLFKIFNKNKQIIIYSTTNQEELLLSKNTMICKDDKNIFDKLETIIFDDVKMKLLGIGVPFIYDLSLQLRLYKIINKTYINESKLVGALCQK